MSEDKNYTLAVVSFDGNDTAKAALGKIQELKKEGAINLEDMVAVQKDEKGKVKLAQGRGLTGAKGTVGFGTAGLIAGTLLGGPIAGAAIGAAIGAGSAHVKKIFDNDELKEMGADLDQDGSLLFLVLSDFVPGSLEGAMEEVGGKMNAFLIAEEGLVAMGAVTEDEAFLAVMQQEVVETVVETVDVMAVSGLSNGESEEAPKEVQ